jgi:hypothetical protein
LKTVNTSEKRKENVVILINISKKIIFICQIRKL